MGSLEFFEAVVGGGEGSRLTVRHTHERNGWAALPPALASRLLEAHVPLPLALELRPLRQRAGVSLPSETPCYVAWEGASSGMAGCVSIPAGLARALGLAEGTPVALRPLPTAPPAVSVTVEPASEDDWEIVELNAAYLEDQLLSQVGVASLHQPLPVWIRSVGVMLRVTALDPAAPVARLVPGSEVHVAPKLRVRPSAAVAAGSDLLAAQQQAHGGNGKLAGQRHGNQAADQAEEDGQEEDASAAPLQAVLRVQQVSDAVAAGVHAAPQPQQGQQGQLPPGVRQVFACAATLARCGLQPGDWVRLAGRNSRSLVKFASLAASDLAAPGHLALTAQQCEWAGAPPFSHIRLQRLTRGQRQLVAEAAELQAGKNGTAGSSEGLAHSAPENGSAQQGQQQAASSAGNGTAQQQAGGVVGAAPPLAGASWLRQATEQALSHLLPILGLAPRSLLQSWGAPRPGGLLVCGPAGSGKSALLAGAAAVLQQHPQCLTYSVTVSCRDITAESTGQAQAQIMPKVREALDHMPSLLVFDDLDVLCPAEAAGADGAASSADPALVTWLADLLDYLSTPSPEWGRLPVLQGDSTQGSAAAAAAGQNGGGPTLPAAAPRSSAVGGGATGPLLWPPVAVAATCRDAAALASRLRVAGRLDHTVSLPAPTADSRAAILAAAAAARCVQLDTRHLRMVAEKADGFDAADLEVLLDRALHVAVRRQLAAGGSTTGSSAAGGRQLAASLPGAGSANGSNGAGSGGSSGGGRTSGSTPAGVQLQLTQEDMEEALEGFTPAAFWGTGTRKAVQAGVAGWGDVGGMEDARQALFEALELPTKYARLVAQAPLRLRTGVLLYGPPGCGKTHIVAAAVAAANVRCITVSGPELLNKYIGASEAAVRDVFARAAAAAPAVLFFDEFDAIAPQRGHDNTGVTDRVVNQLLTELDGVEGLRGVCVVAATSRPDLIDAALLRPGRLDRLVFCGFPSPTERGQVLGALARGVDLAPDVDLALVGYNAEFSSGADLGALLAEAQLAAVHEALEADEAQQEQQSSTASEGAPGRPHTHPRPGSHRRSRPPVIETRHLNVALTSARPSVPEAERDRLEAIYARFRQDSEPGSQPAVDKGKGKVSWA